MYSAARMTSSSCSTTMARVADVHEVPDCAQQAFVVALVQADGGLVQDVAHTDQPAAGAAVARRMRWASPPESVGAAPVERQVAQPHAVHEAQPLADLTQNRVGYVLGLRPVKRSSSKNRLAALIDSRTMSLTLCPGLSEPTGPSSRPMRTASASGRSRAP